MKFYVDYEEAEDGVKVEDKIGEYLKENEVYNFESLTIGDWGEAYEESPDSIIKYLVENKVKFPVLKKIYLGDMDYEECEVSWINHTDTAPLINEFKLEELIIKGSEGLRLINIESEPLKKLTIICGGLPNNVLEDILNAKLPNLEHLELYLGVENYGFEGSIEDIEPFMKKEQFPKIKYLGLKNSEIEDEICEKIIQSNILSSLETLDLSYGTLGDKGANFILENIEKLIHLKTLDLTYNYISDELIEKIEEAFKTSKIDLLIDRDDAEYDEDDEEYRYPYITE